MITHTESAALRSPSTNFYFDRDRLTALADELHDEFVGGDPFPHVMIDDFVERAWLDEVLAEFPEPNDTNWHRFAKATEVKLALEDTSVMGPATRHLLAEFNGQVFMRFLEQLTGIKGLVADHTYSGGGLHQIRSGGFLRIHADFNRHNELRLDRRLNALLYLNHDWSESFGGALELWNKEMSQAVKSYAPHFGRLVIFATTDSAYHGHPDPLRCPDDRSRRSLALYYYTNGRPPAEVSKPHTTLFRTRPGEQFVSRGKSIANRWVPPGLIDLVQARRRQ